MKDSASKKIGGEIRRPRLSLSLLHTRCGTHEAANTQGHAHSCTCTYCSTEESQAEQRGRVSGRHSVLEMDLEGKEEGSRHDRQLEIPREGHLSFVFLLMLTFWEAAVLASETNG